MAIRVLIIDPQPLIRLGLMTATVRDDDIEVIGQASTGDEGLAMFQEQKPDVTLLSLRLPDMCAADDLGRFFEIEPAAKIIVRAEGAGDAEIQASLESGAVGFLSGNVSTDELVTGIKKVHGGTLYVEKSISETLDAAQPNEKLTASETDVLHKLVGGMSNAEIAFALDISENTVKTHVRHIFEKMGVSDRTSATVAAIRRGLVRVDI
ncbi:MAG: response regulator transcription factor [Acidobacteriota bacterium]|nr:response regulator transcription factor [Acidobacteriota bacterium]MDH3529517.1 response regulator transcription factor [Acidobacteriota bacterium]